MRFRWRWALTLMAATTLTAGCGGEVPDDELGEIIYEVPDLPEAQQPFEMPRLKPPKRVPVAGPAAPSRAADLHAALSQQARPDKRHSKAEKCDQEKTCSLLGSPEAEACARAVIE